MPSHEPRLQWTHQPLDEVLDELRAHVRALAPGQIFRFRVPNPELATGLYSGQLWTQDHHRLRHRGYRTWIDLAELLGCRMVTPKPAPNPFVDMRFQKLGTRACLDRAESELSTIQDPSERYGEQSEFSKIQKLEEPCFLQDLHTAYTRVGASQCKRVLSLGVHRGDELTPLAAMWAHAGAHAHRCVGVDHCRSALAQARGQFDARFSFMCDDIQHYEAWDFDPFDLIVSIGTLQCRDVNGKTIFPKLLRKWLCKGGAVILGFPYARYTDGEIRQGGQTRNFSEAEHSLVFKDLMFYRKLLQRRAERVTVTGRYYLFITAWSRPYAA